MYTEHINKETIHCLKSKYLGRGHSASAPSWMSSCHPWNLQSSVWFCRRTATQFILKLWWSQKAKVQEVQSQVKAALIRQHLLLIRQLIQEKYSSTTPKSIRTIDPNNHSDTETGTLFISICTKMKTKSSSKFRGCTNCTETGTSGDWKQIQNLKQNILFALALSALLLSAEYTFKTALSKIAMLDLMMIRIVLAP